MRTCTACGNDNPERSRFCNGCGAELEIDAAAATDERKIVSVLFCDLVGSTAWGERLDPEDIRAVIRPYHELLRHEIGSFGGTVEKFIGDAVMAVFGAPTSHEDDPERAVRAGLRILEAIEELNENRGTDLEVRIGINTGEVVVALGARPELGEGIVTGDVVNTAARLQTGAPAGAIAVGESTYRSTMDVFDYEPLEAFTAKGKAEPLLAWRALGARARLGADRARRHEAALVGRESEQARLQSLLDQTLHGRSCQLVSILGEAGVGKSRMVYELSRLAAARDEFVIWRQGRCLPYGEGVAFWALGEIVKAEAKILDSDRLEEAEAKLDRALRDLSFEPGELAWVRARLAPLVGIESPSSAKREESFTAWRRFLEVLAGFRGAVFVFEDLHWADLALLEFVQHVVDRAEGVPMLLVCTARTEFSERHPNWPGHLRNTIRLNLAPLSEEESASLVEGLLGSSILPVDVRGTIVERAGGNPLYAEEFVRLLRDRGLLVSLGQTWVLAEGAEIPFPEGIHGIISARLDALAPDRKGLLHDASVIGKVFWSGALEAMGDRDGSWIRGALDDLTSKEFLRTSPVSSMEGENEYEFWHMLVRDAAYAQIPRAAKADKHVAVAHWLERRAGERVEDLADVLAHHIFEALELARASGRDTRDLEQQALRYLVLAGDRASNLDTARALVMYERALALTDEGDPVRAEILLDLGNVEFLRGRFGRSSDFLQEAIPALRGVGQPARSADAKGLLAIVLGTITRSGSDRRLLDEAVAELEGLPPGKELIGIYAKRAGWDSASGLNVEAIGWADKSLSLAEELGIPEDPWARIARGRARWWNGDEDGLDDIRRGIDVALERGLTLLATYGHDDLALTLLESTGPTEALREVESGAALARRSGVLSAAESIQLGRGSEVLYALGRWDELMDATAAYLASDREDEQIRLTCEWWSCLVSIWRGDLARATELGRSVHERIRRSEDADVVVGLGVVADLALASGDVVRASSVLREFEAYPDIRRAYGYVNYLPEATRVALRAVDLEFAQQLVSGIAGSSTAKSRISLEMVEAQLAEARGELGRAVELYASSEEGWRTFSVPERAQSLLGWGRCLLAMKDPGAAAVLREAREIFVSLRAERYIPEVDSRVEQAVARSS